MHPRQLLAGLLLVSSMSLPAYDQIDQGPEPLVYVDADVFLIQLDSQLRRGEDYEVIFVGGKVSANELPDRINTLFTRIRDAGGDIRVRVQPQAEVRQRGLDDISDGVRGLSRAVDGIEQLLTTRDKVGRILRGDPYRGYSIEMEIHPNDATVSRLLLVRDQ